MWKIKEETEEEVGAEFDASIRVTAVSTLISRGGRINHQNRMGVHEIV